MSGFCRCLSVKNTQSKVCLSFVLQLFMKKDTSSRLLCFGFVCVSFFCQTKPFRRIAALWSFFMFIKKILLLWPCSELKGHIPKKINEFYGTLSKNGRKSDIKQVNIRYTVTSSRFIDRFSCHFYTMTDITFFFCLSFHTTHTHKAGEVSISTMPMLSCGRVSCNKIKWNMIQSSREVSPLLLRPYIWIIIYI